MYAPAASRGRGAPAGRLFRWRLLPLAVGLVLAGSGWSLHAYRSRSVDLPRGILPGEFEVHESMLLGWGQALPPELEVEMGGLVRETATQMKLVLLIDDPAARQQALTMLQEAGVPPDRAQIVPLDCASLWARDFGPHIVKSFNGNVRLLNVVGIHVAMSDQSIPYHLATDLGFPFEAVELVLEGGNLLSNGSGVILTTTAAIDWNRRAQIGKSKIERLLRSEYGGQDIIFLEPMHGEPCGHVDMFCTFTAPNVVVVGQYDPDVDPINAALLDRNAERLAQVQTALGKLRVERVPMPPRRDNPLPGADAKELWYTYTNVVYANGKLLVPHYRDADPQYEARALAVYRRLLPDWQIVSVPSDALLQLGGSLHCATMNLYRTSR